MHNHAGGADVDVSGSAYAHSAPSNKLQASTKTIPDQTQPFDDALLDSYSDEELLHYIRQSPCLITSRKQAVLILSPGLLAKPVWYDDPMDEVHAMQRARALGVNVPAFRRLVPVDDFGKYYLVMERVVGDTLEQRWPNLGLWGTLCAAWQLRGYLRLLRTVTAQTTGGLHSGRTRSILLDDERGPVRHASPAAFVGYLNWWLVNCRPEYCTPHPELVLKPAKEHFLVHQDLVPRNMILDPRGTLWLVDWGISGFYPEYMEYFGMDATSSLCSMEWLRERTWAAWWGRLRWSLFRWVAAGSASRFREPREAFGQISIRTQRFRLDKTPFSGPL